LTNFRPMRQVIRDHLRLGSAAGAVCILMLACSDSAPARIDYAAPPDTIVNSTFMQLGATVVNAKGKPVGGESVKYAVVPEGILEVSASGEMRCMKAGDTTLVLTGAGLTVDVPLKCRIPTEIQVPESLSLVLRSKPAPLQPKVLGEGGRLMKDVPVEITSSDPAVVAVEGGKLKPVAVGRARVKAAVGTIASVVPVEVVDRVVSEPLLLRDGAQRSWPLTDGDYRVEIDVRPDVRVNQGVVAMWDRAACPNQPEQQSHRFHCMVNDKATLTVLNPKVLGLAATMSGSINIYRVPPE